MKHWTDRLPPKILGEMMSAYGTPHVRIEHVVDWLLTQELDRQKNEKFTFRYNVDTILNHVGDANESN